MRYSSLGIVHFPIVNNKVDNPARQIIVPRSPPLDQFFSIRFASPISRPVTDGTTSVLWCCRGWFVGGEWIWGNALRIIPSDGNRHLIQFPGIPDSLATEATLQKLEFDKVWEGRYRRYINEPNWYLLIDMYNHS